MLFSFQVKPQGGIFFDEYKLSAESRSLQVNYTLVAEKLALYKLPLGDNFTNVTTVGGKIEVDVQRRYEGGREGGREEREGGRRGGREGGGEGGRMKGRK